MTHTAPPTGHHRSARRWPPHPCPGEARTGRGGVDAPRRHPAPGSADPRAARSGASAPEVPRRAASSSRPPALAVPAAPARTAASGVLSRQEPQHPSTGGRSSRARRQNPFRAGMEEHKA
jgi:hypothetical protein